MRIQSKLFLFAIFGSVLPLVAVFALSFNAANKSLTNTVKQNLLSQAAEQLETLQLNLSHSKHMLRTLSELSTMQNVRSINYVGNLQKDLDMFAMHTPIFAEIIAVDYKGIAVAGTIKKHVGTDHKGTWEFEAPKMGIDFDGKVVESFRLNNLVSTQSVPLYSRVNKEHLIGTLIGSINWSFLQKQLALNTVFGGKQSLERQVFLESKESGSILYATPGVSVPTELLANASSGSKINRVTLMGQEYKMVSIDSRSYHEFRDPGWRLHVLLDADIAYASVAELKNFFLLVGGSVLVVVLTLAVFFARSIVTPVNSLLIGAERLSAGDYDYKLPKHNGRDEIGQLTQSFNAMKVAVRRKEQELVAKTEISEQAARSKGEFLANMSHEVRTPINGVLGMTELLLSTSLDAKQNRYANTISRSGKALLAVINDILDYSKIEAGKLELSECAFDLRDLVEDVVEIIADTGYKKGVEVALYMAPECHVAFNGDSARIRQILLNLLSNAVKFTEKGEVRLIVSAGIPEQGETTVSFRVVDTGIGIEERNQKKIFESFVQADGSTTREFGGTGLGLAISSNLVKLMKGEIGIDSVVGQGSTFWFDIELKQLSNTVVLAWRTPDSLLEKSILVVDDNRTNREILETQLGFWGAKPLVVSSAMEALHEIEMVQGSDRTFDAAILDMHMPVMNGLQLAEAVYAKQLAPSTKLVLLSSACDNLDLPSCRSIGIHSVVNKPIRQPDLFNCLTAALNSEVALPIEQTKITKKIEANTLSGRVLLAEDNPVNQEMMLEVLKIIGLSVELACNGEEVLKAFQDNSYDLILMDCQMPIMDGFAATMKVREVESLRGSNERIPIIALTANALQGDKERCLESGMDDYLSKPVSSLQLKETIGKWLEEVKAQADFEDRGAASSSIISHINSDIPTAIDGHVYAELLAICENASVGFYSKLFNKYEETSFQDLATIAKAVESNDAELVSATAHRLKSSSASWGAIGLTAHLQTLESAGKSSELEDAAELMKQIVQEHENLIAFLRVQESIAA